MILSTWWLRQTSTRKSFEIVDTKVAVFPKDSATVAFSRQEDKDATINRSTTFNCTVKLYQPISAHLLE